MITLDNLPKITKKKNKRVGRGYGSGVGIHTVGRGQKGQKTRDTAKPLFEGTKSNKDFFRRTPMLRGKGKLKSYATGPIIIKSSALAVFKENDVVDVKTLVKAKLVKEADASLRGVKILFDKEPGKKLQISVPASKKVIAALG
jgi:ribosomal protein L15